MWTTGDGAFMEPRGCNRWQSVANRIGAEGAKTSENRCRGLRPVADRSAWLRRGSPFESGRGLRRFRCRAGAWVLCFRKRPASYRDSKIRARAPKHPLELRHAAEQPERDPLDRDPLSPCPQRVPVLVQQQRAEEESGRDERHRQMRTATEPRVRRRKDPGRERPDEQREDDQPTPVEADRDAGDSAGDWFPWVLVHEQNVALGAPRHRLVDGAAEQPLEETAFAAADDDQVGVPLVGDVEQPLGRIAQLDDVFGLDLPARKRDASSLELPP